MLTLKGKALVLVLSAALCILGATILELPLTVPSVAGAVFFFIAGSLSAEVWD